MSNNKLDVRVYPIAEPQGNTLAFASISVDNLVAINSLRVVDSEKGMFVAMPQSQDNTGIYHDIAFPLTKELRDNINTAVISEFAAQLNLYPEQRGYMKSEQDTRTARSAADVALDVKVFPINEPRGDTVAFASVGLDDNIAIRGIRVVQSDKGLFVSMPQSKDKEGGFHDIAFPLSGDLRKAVSNAILSEYKQHTAERRQSVGDQLRDGADKATQYKTDRAAQPQAAKRSAGNVGLE